MKTIILLALISILTVHPGSAQVDLNKVGQSTMNFQLVSLSAKAAALGDAVYGTSTGSEAIFYNPAGIVESKQKFDVSLFHTGWIADISYNAGAITMNVDNWGAVGISALWVDYGTINATRLLTSVDAVATNPLGYEDMGPMTNVGAYAFGVSYARAINDQFSIGGTMRLTGQNLGISLLSDGEKQNNASKLVFDGGVEYNTGYKGFRFGMAIRNFSSQIKREEIEEQLPLTFTMGAAINLLDIAIPDHDKQSSFRFSADYLQSNNYSERMNYGIEYIFLGTVALRGGYQTNRDIASWSGGLGVMTSLESYDVQVNYSYSSFKYFDGVHRFSLGFGF